MTAYYKNLGKTLNDVLEELYDKFGYYYCKQKSFVCEGQSGMERISTIMEDLHNSAPDFIDGEKVVKINDYSKSVSTDTVSGEKTAIDLPKSNVISYFLENGSSLIVRPSGTEPKIKLYIGAVGKTASDAEQKLDSLETAGVSLLGF